MTYRHPFRMRNEASCLLFSYAWIYIIEICDVTCLTPVCQSHKNHHSLFDLNLHYVSDEPHISTRITAPIASIATVRMLKFVINDGKFSNSDYLISCFCAGHFAFIACFFMQMTNVICFGCLSNQSTTFFYIGKKRGIGKTIYLFVLDVIESIIPDSLLLVSTAILCDKFSAR